MGVKGVKGPRRAGQLFYPKSSTEILLEEWELQTKEELNTLLLLTYGIREETILAKGSGELLLKLSSLLSTVH